VLLVVTGIGGPASAIAFDLARESNRHERGGAATGVVNIGGFTGAVLADLAIGGLLDTVGRGGHSRAGFDWAMSVIPVMVALGMTAFWWCGRPRPDGEVSATGDQVRVGTGAPPVVGRANV
jgi:MFS family permease